MELSNRLNKIINLCSKCESIIDVGTDHGYVPIKLIQLGICNFAIASDINKGPVERALNNIKSYGLESRIQCRKGPGLNTVKKKEVQGSIIAGMGGNLIRDILIDSFDKVKELQYIVLQPTQNPEILREYLYNNNFQILDEELCKDEDIYYQIIKVRYDNQCHGIYIKDPIYYHISPLLINKKHPLIKEYVEFKVQELEKILIYLKGDSKNILERKVFLEEFKNKLEELLKCI
ncbi:class I SAM-dependent methyltransferase [Clostridium sp. MSJ-4]|uniref:Class I SAM-dependent methyltransferase n=1 Tax=Clostridium simiarum TaxID=2841506 RepID=A0ABS6EZD4_9CLOT|nr:class I SAM-dependent methyltransferase [Clostridium simiarum]MBU5591009.1 class I SAM-dependent methyltransferase [Clostridium simiarum]